MKTEASESADAFAELLARLAPTDEWSLQLARKLWQGVANGDSCLKLGAGQRQRLLSWPVVGLVEGDQAPARPLLVEGDRLYLRRYWLYERSVAEALARLAAAARLTLISGGPGTGKTTSVVELLCQRLASALESGAQMPQIALCAPTGKAAARLREAVAAARSRLAGHYPAEVLNAIPHTTLTLHRLLGIGRTGIGARQGPRHPLASAIVVIDEASMVDLALMAKLCAALASHAELIMLGDPDQLSAVETGEVFPGLIRAAMATSQGALAGSHRRLTKTHRFDADSAINRLAVAALAGDADAFIAQLAEPRADLRYDQRLPSVRELAARFVLPRAGADEQRSALTAFRVLCALRSQNHGVDALNHAIHRRMAPRRHRWAFAGAQLVVRANDAEAEIYNGDLGLVVDADEVPQVAFAGACGEGLRVLPMAALPAWEWAYALTVHQAQGSEFDEVLVVLPPTDHPLLSRQWLYTALTRARQRLWICANETVLRAALTRNAQRLGGLEAQYAARAQAGAF